MSLTQETDYPVLNEAARRNARVLWDYHNIDCDLPGAADFVLAMGSHDLRVAERAAELILDGLAPVLVTSGGGGKVTSALWKNSEAERFAEVARNMGVPKKVIFVEKRSKNTGENIRLTLELMTRLNLAAEVGVIVAKPYMKRRALATAKKISPWVAWYVDAPRLTFEEYSSPQVPEKRMIELMVGDLQRIELYADQGLQVVMEIPDVVRVAYDELVRRGFNRFLIR